MGDIKCLTADKLGHPAAGPPVTAVLRGEGVLGTREQQADDKKQAGPAGPRVPRSEADALSPWPPSTHG